MVRFPRHTRHRIQSAGQPPMAHVSADCCQSKRPADSHVCTLCQLNGWDDEPVRGKEQVVLQRFFDLFYEVCAQAAQ